MIQHDQYQVQKQKTIYLPQAKCFHFLSPEDAAGDCLHSLSGCGRIHGSPELKKKKALKPKPQ